MHWRLQAFPSHWLLFTDLQVDTGQFRVSRFFFGSLIEKMTIMLMWFLPTEKIIVAISPYFVGFAYPLIKSTKVICDGY